MLRIAAIGVSAFVTAGGTARAARPVTFDDIMAIRRASEAGARPDKSSVLSAVRGWECSARNPQTKGPRSQNRKVSDRGGDARPLTFQDAAAGAPAWSPAGRSISFLSGRGGEGALKATSR